MRPGAVIFDMDGLMFDTERMARGAWERAMADWGYTFAADLYLTVVGRTAERAMSIFREAFGADCPIEDIYQRKQQYVEEAIEHGGVPVKPGLVELLDSLERWRLRKAVASSTASAMVLERLARAGLAQHFSVVVGGNQVRRGKPAPDLFLEAAQQLGVKASACLALEDSDAGVRAAHAAGMLPVMVPDLKPPSAEVVGLAFRVLPSLHEVRPLMEELLGLTCKPT